MRYARVMALTMAAVQALACGGVPAAEARDVPWSEGLVNAGDGLWPSRAIVRVANRTDVVREGEALCLLVGTGSGELPLTGERAESVRVCDRLGRELLFEITTAEGRAKFEGLLAAGDRLTFCVDLGPKDDQMKDAPPSVADYAVYFGNTYASAPLDHLTARLANGGFEAGDQGPERWSRRSFDEQHRLSRVTDSPRSGKRCVHAVVDDGAERTWVQYCQSGIRVASKARYRLTAWVRAKDVQGRAGWYVHVNGDKPMVVNRVANAGDGTYDWRRVTIEFDTPPDAKNVTVGTVLYGTGEAWYDDVSLERLDKRTDVVVESITVERREVREVTGSSEWLVSREQWPYRVRVVAANVTARELRDVMISVNLKRIARTLAGPDQALRVLVVDPAATTAEASSRQEAVRFHPNWMWTASLPARTRKTFHLYLAPAERSNVADEKASYAKLLASPANLAKNPSFEDGQDLPTAWHSTMRQMKDAECKLARVDDGLLGLSCTRLDVPKTAPKRWYGWTQDRAPVQPNADYLLAGWLKCRDVEDRHVALHGHFHTADGGYTQDGKFFSTSGTVSGTQDWTLSRSFVRTPGDAATVSMHLTMFAHGTVWHDGILLCRVVRACVGLLESDRAKADLPESGLAVWQVNPIVKVFREDLPSASVKVVRAAAARNEYEPIQLVLWSDRPRKNVRVSVLDLRRNGASLPAVQVDRVGYVPVDVPSSYYRSDLPAHYRLVPKGVARTDGWAGDWPDPLPPCEPFDLPAGQAQPIWLTAYVPKGVPAGVYEGQVVVEADGGLRRELPIRFEVWPFELPDRPSLRVIYDLRRGRRNPFGDGTIAEYRKWYELLARRRISPGLLPPPTFRYDDGKVTMDTEKFDAAASICIDELKMNVFYSPHVFYAFGWAYTPRKFLGREPFTDAYKEAVSACYRAYLDHLKQRGWYDECVNYISDEPHYTHDHVVEQMKQVCDLYHAVDANVPLYSSTWRHVPQWNGYLDIWGVGQYGCFPVEEMERRRAAGETLWFTCDGQQALDTPYLATERLLPYYCYKYDVQGYEFWGVSWWTYDPWERGWHRFIRQSSEGEDYFWVRYPNGDGYLTYPGEAVGLDRPVSSLRLEQAREGIEDYEYIRILERLIVRARESGKTGEAESAAKALDRARDLVTIPNAGGVRSTDILPNPDAVPAVRAALAREIVRLGELLGE